MSDDYIFETEGLTYKYSSRQEKPSLDDVNIKIKRGVRTAILGANGAGKSTLFYHFNGIFKPMSGTVKYNGVPLDYDRDALTELRKNISVVVQNPDEQIFSATVEEDIAFGPMNCGMEREDVEKAIQDSLFKVNMEEYRYRPTIQLSYGQRKRIAFAGALSIMPDVLILDEPTAGLDPQMSQDVIELVDQMVEAGTTVIISTHDVDLAYAWAEEIHVLRHGKLVFSGVPEDFFADLEQVFLTGLTIPHTYSVNFMAQSIKGEPLEPHPRTNSQILCKMLPDESVAAHIKLVPVKEGSDLVEEEGAVGVYGSDARRLFASKDRVADYHFNAIECCLMEAINGRSSTLYCDERMIPFVEGRIASLAEFGSHVEVRR